ncbi:YycH family regulatory protein [Bacillus sp. 1P06AnD]|uniref:YycH family regulatory protein n=1 Tax=Bacillus sp. 1P06AnD TaxID=3132208 RepID=UPI0039A2E48C
MNKEGIKTIVLTFLVLFSALMTWNIWTYSPNIKEINTNDYINNVAISSKIENMSDIFKPSQLIYHNENGHLGTYSEHVISSLIMQMQNWQFYGFQQLKNINPEQFKDFSHKDGMAEFIFPDDVSFSLYKKELSVNGKELPDFEFDRLLLPTLTGNSQENYVYFLSTTDMSIIRMNVGDNKNIADFQKKLKEVRNSSDMKTMINVKNKNMYIPANSLQVNKSKYFIDKISSTDFKNALFSEPNNVTKKHTPFGEQYSYSNGRSVMNVYNESLILIYENLIYNNLYEPIPSELIDRSISYMNDHAGWENGYRFFEVDEKAYKTKFRLYMNSLPVFNEDGMSEIKEVWGKNEISQYQRPTFNLGSVYDSHQDPVTIPSGTSILQTLTRNNVDLDNLEGLTIGYELQKKNDQTLYIVLKPAWFYKVNGEWKQVETDKEEILSMSGGRMNGLEQN